MEGHFVYAPNSKLGNQAYGFSVLYYTRSMNKTTSVVSRLFGDGELREMAALSCSKTLSGVPEVRLEPKLFCQPIDVGIELDGDTAVDIPNMVGYPMRSAENALTYVRHLKTLDISSTMVRMNTPPALQRLEALKRQGEIVRALRSSDEALQIIVDPFSLALNTDKTWGVKQNGRLDYLATAELFARLTEEFAAAGASYVLTLGRFEREVDVTRRALSTADKTAVCSFSTNTETTNAYVYADHDAYAPTKQKILVSNFQEMVFRALVDMHEGSSLVIVKPAENLHVLEKLVMFCKHPELLEGFLDSARVQALVGRSPYLRRVLAVILEDLVTFVAKMRGVRLGTYTVSGTYFTDTQTCMRQGEDFLQSVLEERFCNIAAVLDEHNSGGLIVDRNAARFFEYAKSR